MKARENVIVCGFLVVILSTIFGYLPALFTYKCRGGSSDDQEINYEPSKKEKKDKKLMRQRKTTMSVLLNFGGGVLIANCFCHWLPEVREGIRKAAIDTNLPLAEIIMCGGFFFICFLEELIHHYIHSHKHISESDAKSKRKKVRKNIKCNSQVQRLDMCHKHKKYDQEDPCTSGGVVSCKKILSNISNEIQVSVDGSCNTNGKHASSISASNLVSIKIKEEDEEQKRNIRTFFVVFALSFHSVIAGLALGLETNLSGIWMNFAAMALHKFVIAFSIGVELVAAETGKVQYFISMTVFSVAPAIGMTIGLILIECKNAGSSIDNFPIQVVQGIATGAVVYVIFFEIFPKAKAVGGTGFQHIIAMAVGFAVFLPSLLFHVHDEEGHEHDQ